MENNDEILQIDLDTVIRQRAPGVYRFTPRFLIRALERLICQDRMNSLLVTNHGKKGAEFCRGVLDFLEINCTVTGLENLPPASDTEAWRVIFVSNHPLGGLDGMALIDIISSLAPGRDMRFIVNDLLMNIAPLQNVFLPVNTLSGKQTRQGATDIDNVMAGPMPIAIFPAGLCSRLIDGRIQDMTWNKMFVNKAIRYKRNIIPIYFKGMNSGFFYKFAKLRKSLSIPINLEMSLLPRELFRNSGCEFGVTFGEPIGWETLKGGIRAADEAQRIRNTVYSLRP